MNTIQPGHEVKSLFGLNPDKSALTSVKEKSLTATIVSAFLFVLILGLALGFAQRVLDKNKSIASAATTISSDQEPAAFIPGRFVSEQINQGYLGN